MRQKLAIERLGFSASEANQFRELFILADKDPLEIGECYSDGFFHQGTISSPSSDDHILTIILTTYSPAILTIAFGVPQKLVNDG